VVAGGVAALAEEGVPSAAAVQAEAGKLRQGSTQRASEHDKFSRNTRQSLSRTTVRAVRPNTGVCATHPRTTVWCALVRIASPCCDPFLERVSGYPDGVTEDR
jgi:hypothetical protein